MARLMALIAITHIAALTLLVLFKEARYFIQIYPMLYYFVGIAAERAYEKIDRENGRVWRLATAAIAIITLGLILRGTSGEAANFSDSEYRNDVIIRMGQYVRDHSDARNKILFIGEPILINPGNLNLTEDDGINREFYYRFSTNANAIDYYSDRRSYSLFPFEPTPAVKDRPNPGDLMLLGPSSAAPVTTIFPIQRLANFERKNEENGAAIFVDTFSHARLQAAKGAKLQLQGGNQLYLIWDIILRNQAHIFMDAAPLPPAPAITAPPLAVATDDVSGLLLIPLDAPINSFETRPDFSLK